LLLISLMAVAPEAKAQSTLRVEVTGQVLHAGVLNLPAPARLRDAIDAAKINHDAYSVGASWFQARLRTPQQRLKAGIVFELAALARPSPLSDRRAALSGAAQTMLTMVQLLPVTGRNPGIKLDPELLEISQQDNYLLGEGDRLVYPTRPTTVRVVGAVLQPCVLPQQGLQDVRAYLKNCPLLHVADKDTVYLIQPDGKIFALGIALWDRSRPTPMAPGAVLYVPFDDRLVANLDDGHLNRDIANFLATQPTDSWNVVR